MKTLFNFYLLPPLLFILLAVPQLENPTVREFFLGVLGSISVGLLAGFTLHMATVIGKKLRNR
ncbi:hypothetical protein [Halalkalibacterium ligniniphilum]|uniref:hypothetical protein n=1 Tax=Halalkalibacterium ligniniphilum TaxID=1134413 RepID=UPI0003465F6B|nr:hypothetical protein [Halalkalibacterium ligniniphilum]